MRALMRIEKTDDLKIEKKLFIIRIKKLSEKSVG
jgi:hypothetical protein